MVEKALVGLRYYLNDTGLSFHVKYYSTKIVADKEDNNQLYLYGVELSSFSDDSGVESELSSDYHYYLTDSHESNCQIIDKLIGLSVTPASFIYVIDEIVENI